MNPRLIRHGIGILLGWVLWTFGSHFILHDSWASAAGTGIVFAVIVHAAREVAISYMRTRKARRR